MCRAASARRSPGWPAQQWTGNQRAGRASVAEKAAGPIKAVAAAANTSAAAGNWAAEQLASWALDSGRTVLGSDLLA